MNERMDGLMDWADGWQDHKDKRVDGLWVPLKLRFVTPLDHIFDKTDGLQTWWANVVSWTRVIVVGTSMIYLHKAFRHESKCTLVLYGAFINQGWYCCATDGAQCVGKKLCGWMQGLLGPDKKACTCNHCNSKFQVFALILRCHSSCTVASAIIISHWLNN